MVYTVTSDSGYTYTYKNKTAYDSDPNKPKTSTESNTSPNNSSSSNKFSSSSSSSNKTTSSQPDWNNVQYGQIIAAGYKNLSEYKEAYQEGKAPDPKDIKESGRIAGGGSIYTYKPTGQQIVVDLQKQNTQSFYPQATVRYNGAMTSAQTALISIGKDYLNKKISAEEYNKKVSEISRQSNLYGSTSVRSATKPTLTETIFGDYSQLTKTMPSITTAKIEQKPSIFQTSTNTKSDKKIATITSINEGSTLKVTTTKSLLDEALGTEFITSEKITDTKTGISYYQNKFVPDVYDDFQGRKYKVQNNKMVELTDSQYEAVKKEERSQGAAIVGSSIISSPVGVGSKAVEKSIFGGLTKIINTKIKPKIDIISTNANNAIQKNIFNPVKDYIAISKDTQIVSTGIYGTKSTSNKQLPKVDSKLIIKDKFTKYEAEKQLLLNNKKALTRNMYGVDTASKMNLPKARPPAGFNENRLIFKESLKKPTTNAWEWAAKPKTPIVNKSSGKVIIQSPEAISKANILKEKARAEASALAKQQKAFFKSTQTPEQKELFALTTGNKNQGLIVVDNTKPIFKTSTRTPIPVFDTKQSILIKSTIYKTPASEAIVSKNKLDLLGKTVKGSKVKLPSKESLQELDLLVKNNPREKIVNINPPRTELEIKSSLIKPKPLIKTSKYETVIGEMRVGAGSRNSLVSDGKDVLITSKTKGSGKLILTDTTKTTLIKTPVQSSKSKLINFQKTTNVRTSTNIRLIGDKGIVQKTTIYPKVTPSSTKPLGLRLKSNQFGLTVKKRGFTFTPKPNKPMLGVNPKSGRILMPKVKVTSQTKLIRGIGKVKQKAKNELIEINRDVRGTFRPGTVSQLELEDSLIKPTNMEDFFKRPTLGADEEITGVTKIDFIKEYDWRKWNPTKYDDQFGRLISFPKTMPKNIIFSGAINKTLFNPTSSKPVFRIEPTTKYYPITNTVSKTWLAQGQKQVQLIKPKQATVQKIINAAPNPIINPVIKIFNAPKPTPPSPTPKPPEILPPSSQIFPPIIYKPSLLGNQVGAGYGRGSNRFGVKNKALLKSLLNTNENINFSNNKRFNKKNKKRLF